MYGVLAGGVGRSEGLFEVREELLRSHVYDNGA